MATNSKVASLVSSLNTPARGIERVGFEVTASRDSGLCALHQEYMDMAETSLLPDHILSPRKSVPLTHEGHMATPTNPTDTLYDPNMEAYSRWREEEGFDIVDAEDAPPARTIDHNPARHSYAACRARLEAEKAEKAALESQLSADMPDRIEVTSPGSMHADYYGLSVCIHGSRTGAWYVVSREADMDGPAWSAKAAKILDGHETVREDVAQLLAMYATGRITVRGVEHKAGDVIEILPDFYTLGPRPNPLREM